VPDADYDCAEGIMTFYVPSATRPVTYAVAVDAMSAERDCACMDFQCRQRARKNRANKGVALELLAAERGYHLLPSILRGPSALCPHTRKARAWLKRHGLFPALEEITNQLTTRILAKPVKESKKAS
jgi:hypothetical protein